MPLSNVVPIRLLASFDVPITDENTRDSRRQRPYVQSRSDTLRYGFDEYAPHDGSLLSGAWRS